jgi:MoaA/NifB/PqqE/SkfB family radical SAM enzyme
LHDSLTRVDGSFEQLVAGVKNILDIGIERIASNTTIIKQNYKYLPEIGKFIYNLGIHIAEFIFVDSNQGGAHDDFKELVPKISQAALYMRKCLNFGRRENLEHWHVRYVPLCYFQGYEKQISELNEVEIFQTSHFAPDFRNFDVENSRREIGRIKPEKCKGCLKYNICEGIWVEYYNHFGDRELEPIKEKNAPYSCLR